MAAFCRSWPAAFGRPCFCSARQKNMEIAKLQEVGTWEGEVRSFNDGH